MYFFYGVIGILKLQQEEDGAKRGPDLYSKCLFVSSIRLVPRSIFGHLNFRDTLYTLAPAFIGHPLLNLHKPAV